MVCFYSHTLLFLLLREKGRGEWEAPRKNIFSISLEVTPPQAGGGGTLAVGSLRSYPVSLPPSRLPEGGSGATQSSFPDSRTFHGRPNLGPILNTKYFNKVPIRVIPRNSKLSVRKDYEKLPTFNV